MDDKNFSLFIRKNIKNKELFKKIKKDHSILKNYETICKDINEVYFEKEIESNKLKLMEIYLNHPKIGKIIVYNKEEWMILYNYNIIDECITKEKKLKIDYKMVSHKDTINEEQKRNNFKNIIEYIMEKVPKEFYLNSLLKFFTLKNEVAELFKSFFFNELFNSSLDSIKKELKLKNDNLLENENNTKSMESNDKNYEEKIRADSIFLTRKEELLEQMNKYINQILKNNKSFYNIVNIIKENEEEKTEKENLLEISEDQNLNQTETNDQKVEKIKNEILPSPDENTTIFSSLFNPNIERNKFFDKNELLKKFNKEEYYDGIDQFKENLKAELFNKAKN